MSITRRNLLVGTAAGVIGVGLAAPAVLAQSTTQVTFAFGPDESGAVQALIDGFNAQNESGIEVTWLEGPEESDAFFRFLISEFEAGANEIDLFGSDVIWTAEMAANKFIRDLSSRIFGQLDTSGILPAALNSAYYNNRLWAAPWYTEAGMMYYRRDLLDQAGITEPPQTWDELASAAKTVMEKEGIAHGLVLQGASYEGGTTNALEFIWSAGGRAWTPRTAKTGIFGSEGSGANVIVLKSQASENGLAKARELIETGVMPPEVTDFNERDSIEVFASGNAVFMRNWPSAYGLIGSQEFGPVTQDQIGVSRIPTLRPDLRSYSCLGGWNLAISRASRKTEAAWQFIKWALDPERQRQTARTAGYLPVLAELYEDDALRSEVPVVALGEQAVKAARARPSSAIYSRLSNRLAIMFNRVLSGDVPAGEAIERTTNELRNIASRYR